jgi:putative phosphoribosyl transferase
MPFDYAVPSVPDGSRIDYSDRLLVTLFRNRRDAGRRLAVALAPYRENRPIVFALPRGGVPVGFEVAKALAAPLDVLLVCKIGAPGHEELGLGAVVDGHGPQLVLNEDIVRAVAPPPGYIEAEEQRQLAEIERRRQHYIGDRSPVAVEGRTIIVVDDGIATGATVKAALRGLARNRPARLVLAVPVAPADSLEELSAECDEVVCLATPDPFYAVGPHYRDFRQTEDAEVVRLLDEARQWSTAEPSTPATPS